MLAGDHFIGGFDDRIAEALIERAKLHIRERRRFLLERQSVD